MFVLDGSLISSLDTLSKITSQFIHLFRLNFSEKEVLGP